MYQFWESKISVLGIKKSAQVLRKENAAALRKENT